MQVEILNDVAINEIYYVSQLKTGVSKISLRRS